MEKAYLREIKQSNQCELVFPLRILNDDLQVIVETEIHSLWSSTDLIRSLLTHTERKVTKILETKNTAEINVETKLTVDGEDAADINCKEFLEKPKKNIVFSILKQQFEVILNAPLVQELALPKIIHANYAFQPIKFKNIFTDRTLSNFQWYSSEDKECWTEVGNGFKYKPTEKDINKYLKVRCIPRNQNAEGPPIEAISQTSVTEMSDIPYCPFDIRHKYTKTFLTNRNQIRVVSYNVLSNLYAENNAEPPVCSPQALSIDYRKQLILKELLGYNADIICLQEVDMHIFSQYLKPRFFKTHKGLFYKKGNKIPEGLACFFNVERFKLIETSQLVFCDEVNINPLFERTWDLIKDCEVLRDTFMKQKTSLQVTVLKSKSSNKIVIVANTHLYYHSEASQIRLLQTSIALDYINDIQMRCKRHSKSPISIIFCGDFNSVPTSPVYEFMLTRTFEVGDGGASVPMCLSHPFEFTSAYGTPKYTNYTIDFKGCLDYIFFDKNTFKVCECVPLPDEDVLAEKTALPNEVFPSDHLALVCTLQWL